MFLIDVAEFGRKVKLSPINYTTRTESGVDVSSKVRGYKRGIKEGSLYPADVTVNVQNTYKGTDGGTYFRNKRIVRKLRGTKNGETLFPLREVDIDTYGKKGSRTTDIDSTKIVKGSRNVKSKNSRTEKYRAGKVRNPWDISTETPKKLDLTDNFQRVKTEQKQVKALPPAKSTTTKTPTPTPVKSTPKPSAKKSTKFINKYSLGALGAAGVLGGGAYAGYRAYQNRKNEGKK